MSCCEHNKAEAGETYWREEAYRWESIARGWERQLNSHVPPAVWVVDSHSGVWGLYGDEATARFAWRTGPAESRAPYRVEVLL